MISIARLVPAAIHAAKNGKSILMTIQQTTTAALSPLGKKIQDHMEKGPDGWHFKLTDKGFCALLRTDGLCEVITALGKISSVTSAQSIPAFSPMSMNLFSAARAFAAKPHASFFWPLTNRLPLRKKTQLLSIPSRNFWTSWAFPCRKA